MNSLANKVTLVTGASKGIGAGIAKAFAAEGATVVVNYASSRKGSERVVAEIVASGGKAIAIQGSVSKPKDVERLFVEIKETCQSAIVRDFLAVSLSALIGIVATARAWLSRRVLVRRT